MTDAGIRIRSHRIGAIVKISRLRGMGMIQKFACSLYVRIWMEFLGSSTYGIGDAVLQTSLQSANHVSARFVADYLDM